MLYEVITPRPAGEAQTAGDIRGENQIGRYARIHRLAEVDRHGEVAGGVSIADQQVTDVDIGDRRRQGVDGVVVRVGRASVDVASQVEHAGITQGDQVAGGLHRRIRGEGRRPGHSRITSYNVCYTKLLRVSSAQDV